jgi:hypothetical protein
MSTKKRVSTLEHVASIKKGCKKEADILEGIEAFRNILDQIDPKKKYPRDTYAMIRKAQKIRADSLKDSSMLLYQDNHATLTTSEKNFIIVHEQDIKGGVLRDTTAATIERINELLQEQQHGA